MLVHVAAEHGHVNILQFATEIFGPYICHNQRDINRKTPLHYAAQNNQLEVAKYIVVSKGDHAQTVKEAEDAEGRFPIDLCKKDSPCFLFLDEPLKRKFDPSTGKYHVLQ